jgi:hypothetical protein
MNLQRTEPRTIYQHSKYVSSNESEASEAWKSILPGHGVVAISPNYAASKNLPDTFVLPNTNGRLAYVIEAYHAIHCIVLQLFRFLIVLLNTKYLSRQISDNTTPPSNATKPGTGHKATTSIASMHSGSM